MPIEETLASAPLDLTVTDVTTLTWEELAAEMYDGPNYTSPCNLGCGTSNGAICSGCTACISCAAPEQSMPEG
ncbi:hypothetical protein ACFOSC_10740 [Streptantibioticus rubrisoli]|uniref:Thiocillin family RiPP n=1 Tax=Streptantibioticus rubrisoli TaxID=1387313 RepID=A0ABT1PEN3_9ACTN|nr:hypothetical protein [Streptantibioticus rubrisoli]MCQ4042780.1 hypothetical protein [Streptantibioticus rubrisoli]